MKLPIINQNALIWAGLLVAAGVAIYIAKKGVSGAVAGATSGIINGVGHAAGGVVLGIGDVFGIPRINETDCEKAKRLNNNFDASRYCSAADFLRWEAAKISGSGGGASGGW